MGRLMGLDVGDRRIGVAFSDPLMITAQGAETYERRTEEEDLRYLEDLAKRQDVSKIVVGLPRHMNGDIGEQAQRVQAFAGALSERAGLPVEYWDERLSTQAALRPLLEADMSRKKRKKVVDKMAAVIILQGYMDTLH